MNQLTDFLSPTATLLAVVLAYVFGRRQTEHERLYTRRAEVIAKLFELFEIADRRIFSLVSPFDAGGEPDKKEKARLASESFNDLLVCYRSNSIWLSRGTNKLFDDFLKRYKTTISEFAIYVIRKGDLAQSGAESLDKWDEVWQRFQRESPEVRKTLEEEFRASLGDRRARISRAYRSLKRPSTSTKDEERD